MADQRFVEVCDEYGNVVVGFAYVFKNEVTSDVDGNLVINGMAVEEKIEPYAALKEAGVLLEGHFLLTSGISQVVISRGSEGAIFLNEKEKAQKTPFQVRFSI